MELWLFDTDTLLAMLKDAERVTNQTINHQEARTIAATYAAAIRLEVEGRGVTPP